MNQSLQTQVTYLLHLLDAARPLHLALVETALGQLLQNLLFVVHPSADDKREPEAPLVLLVEVGQARGLRGVERVQSHALLLLAGLCGKRAAPEVSPRQVRVTPEDPLFT